MGTGRRRTWGGAPLAMAAALVVAVTATGGAMASDPRLDSPTAKHFLELCESPSPELRDICGSLIVSMIDAHVSIGRKHRRLRPFCPSRVLVPDRAREVFLDWARQHPESMGLPFPAAVVESLSARYPCGIIKDPVRRR